jgi:hypothetical protein
LLFYISRSQREGSCVCRGSDRMIVGCTTTVQSVPINTKVVSSNSAHGDVYFIQHYVIKCVSDFRQGCVFFNCTPVSSTNKTNHYDITEILLKIALRIIFVLLPKNSVKQYTVDVSFMWLYSLPQEQLCTLYTVGFCCIMIYIWRTIACVFYLCDYIVCLCTIVYMVYFSSLTK